MPIEENRTVARRVLDDLVSQGRLEVVNQIYAQAFEFCDPTAGQTITARQGMRDLTRDIRTRTPDIAVVIEEEIAVSMRWSTAGPRAGTMPERANSGPRRALLGSPAKVHGHR